MHFPIHLLSTEQQFAYEYLVHASYPSGGCVFISRWVIANLDYARELEMAELAAREFGWKIYLLPELDVNDPLRSILLPGTRRSTANPDYWIDGYYADHKETCVSTTPKNLEHRIEEKLRQGDIILIRLFDNPDDELIEDVVERRLKAKSRLQAVLIVKCNGNFNLYKQRSRS